MNHPTSDIATSIRSCRFLFRTLIAFSDGGVSSYRSDIRSRLTDRGPRAVRPGLNTSFLGSRVPLQSNKYQEMKSDRTCSPTMLPRAETFKMSLARLTICRGKRPERNVYFIFGCYGPFRPFAILPPPYWTPGSARPGLQIFRNC